MTESRDNRPPLITLQEAARAEQVSYSVEKARLRRKRVILVPDEEDQRRKLLPVTELSPNGYARWLKAEISAPSVSSQPTAAPPEALALTAKADTRLQPFLPFCPPTGTERELTAAIPSFIPKHEQPYVDRWTGILAECLNGTWRRYRGNIIGGILIEDEGDFIRVLAQQHGISPSTIYAKKRIWREVRCDPSVPRDTVWSEFWKRMLPKPRPGRAGHGYFDLPENDWACLKLREFYLNQAKLSVKRGHELLCAEIDAKQRTWGLRHLYPKPTLRQCRTALEKLDLPTEILGREGEKAYNDRCAPYISRRPPEHANDVWVTDQRLCNVRLRDGGNRLGRIWAVNFLDVATWRWLGCMFGPVLNSDVVMAAAAMALEHAGVPRAVHMDLGKEFTGKRFLGGLFTVRGEILFRDALGLWKRLDVRPVRAIGRNPQSKIIERWHHELDRFDQEMPGWCGSNPEERPEELMREEAAHYAWLQTGQGQSRLLTIPEYILRYLDFCERRWNAEHRGRGRYLQGMTPNEAWNTRQPEDGRRTLKRDEVDYYTADHRKLKVARGGQVNLTFHGQTIEYAAPELFTHQGQEVEVNVSRRSLRRVTVTYKVPGGTASCVAEAKPLHDWLPEDREELRQALRCRAALRRAVKRGIAASQALAETPALRELPAVAAEIAPELTASFAAPGPRPDREISSTEWVGRKLQRRSSGHFADEIARKALEMEAET